MSGADVNIDELASSLQTNLKTSNAHAGPSNSDQAAQSAAKKPSRSSKKTSKANSKTSKRLSKSKPTRRQREATLRITNNTTARAVLEAVENSSGESVEIPLSQLLSRAWLVRFRQWAEKGLQENVPALMKLPCELEIHHLARLIRQDFIDKTSSLPSMKRSADMAELYDSARSKASRDETLQAALCEGAAACQPSFTPSSSGTIEKALNVLVVAGDMTGHMEDSRKWRVRLNKLREQLYVGRNLAALRTRLSTGSWLAYCPDGHGGWRSSLRTVKPEKFRAGLEAMCEADPMLPHIFMSAESFIVKPTIDSSDPSRADVKYPLEMLNARYDQNLFPRASSIQTLMAPMGQVPRGSKWHAIFTRAQEGDKCEEWEDLDVSCGDNDDDDE